MDAIIPTAADRPTVTLMATILGWENSSQRPHTGRQSEVFSTVVQEKLSWHWSVLQFSCWTSLAVGGGWMVVSSCPPLSPPASTSIITVMCCLSAIKYESYCLPLERFGTLDMLLWFDTSVSFPCICMKTSKISKLTWNQTVMKIPGSPLHK